MIGAEVLLIAGVFLPLIEALLFAAIGIALAARPLCVGLTVIAGLAIGCAVL